MAHRFTDSIREMVQEQMMMKQPRHWGQNITKYGWMVNFWWKGKFFYRYLGRETIISFAHS